MEKALRNAIEQRDQLKASLKRVEAFISNYRAFEAGTLPTRDQREFVVGRPVEVRAQIVAALERAGRPMKSREIIRDCEANGFTIPGRNQGSYVAIIIHRNLSIFQRVEGGYALRRPVEVQAA